MRCVYDTAINYIKLFLYYNINNNKNKNNNNIIIL